MVYPGGNQGGERLRKTERGDLCRRQLSVLSRMQEFRVSPAAGAEWFHRQRVAAALPQVVKEQARQQSFAHTRVSAGDKDDARQAGSVHGTELTTSYLRWTQANYNPRGEQVRTLPGARAISNRS